MEPLSKKLLISRQIEYLAINQDFLVLETSPQITKFAEDPGQILLGKDVRLGFPELIGVENILEEIMNGQEESFFLSGISRSHGNNSLLYFNLEIIGSLSTSNLATNQVFVLIEDVTEKMALEQALVQAVNESNLLLNALKASRNYIHKIIISIAETLIVTNQTGIIKTINPAVTNLLGYTENDLLSQHISVIIPIDQYPDLKPDKCLNRSSNQHITVDLITKNNEKLTIEFSCTFIQTEIESIYNFIYIGRNITHR
ncbi:MAG: PAS domain-containing protein [Microcoleaceae cyanobacterium]